MLSSEKRHPLASSNIVAEMYKLWDKTPDQLKTADKYCFFVNQKTKGIIAEGFWDAKTVYDRPLIVDSRIPDDTIMYTHKAYIEENESIY